jgi:ferrochelatase
MTAQAPKPQSKSGVLLLNLGSPAAPTPEALKPYLEEFLSDRYIVDYPRWLWTPILRGIILRTRPAKSAALYRSIWMEHGSPLIYFTESIAGQLQARLNPGDGRKIEVRAGMRYGSPSIASQVAELISSGIGRLVVLPLFPQYSTTTTQTGLDATFESIGKSSPQLEVEVIKDYHDHPAYIEALANTVRKDWKAHGKPEKLLLSFHGVPKRYCKFDPYVEQCKHTARLLAKTLGLQDQEWTYAFQSRFGPEPWVQPYTDETLKEWGSAGVKSVSVAAPGFAVDCLETLDELARESKLEFIQAGGETFRYIPALNDTPDQLNVLATILRDKFMAGR